MIGCDLRSLLSALLRNCRDIRDFAWRWAGTDDSLRLRPSAGGLRECRHNPHAGSFSRSSNDGGRCRHDPVGRSVPNRDPGQSLVANSGGGVPVDRRDGPRRQASLSDDDPRWLCVARDDLVVANGASARPRNLGASAAEGWGYRSRLEAFLRAASIADPAGSTNRLVTHYATLSELLSADPVIVADYSDESAARALAGAGDLMTWALEEELRKRRPIHSGRDATALLKQLIGFRCDELLIALFLDSGRGLIDHEVIATGRAGSVDIDCRRILLRAIGRGAAGIIVAHNHPSGDPRPSSSDIRVTRRLADVAQAFGIALHDHLVVAGGEIRSAMFGTD